MRGVQTTVILILAVVAMASAVTAIWAVATSHAAKHRFRTALGAAEAMFQGQTAAVWQEGYDQGVADERMATEYNAGTYEKVSANRVNPYGQRKDRP